MSRRYKGGVISATAPVPTGPYLCGTAKGIWTLPQQMQARAANIWPIAGNLAPSSQSYTTAGTYSWVAPAGVSSVSVVAVGGGGAFSRYNECFYCGCYSFRYGPSGGGGGGLGYKNNYAVNPGCSYTVVVGAAGTAPTAFNTNPVSGGNSYFVSTGTVRGGGGGASTSLTVGGTAGTYTGDGGGNGGAGMAGQNNSYQGGPGGAGGYSGAGGAGVAIANNGNAGTGGGGGSPGFTYGVAMAGSGGVGLFGQGSSGAGGTSSPSTGGGGGSCGASGGAGVVVGNPVGNKGGTGGAYGGVMGTSSYGGYSCTGTPYQSSASGGGAVRIVWPGATRSFPSTCVGAP